MIELSVAVQVVLAATLLAAGLGKLTATPEVADALVDFGVARAWTRRVVVVLALVELAVGSALLFDRTRRMAATMAVLLLAPLSVMLLIRTRNGGASGCPCFGLPVAGPVSRARRRWLLARNASLLAASAYLALANHDHAGLSMPAMLAAVVLATGIVVVGRRQATAGLASDQRHGSGPPPPARATILVFLEDGCPSCIQLARDIAVGRLLRRGPERLVLVCSGVSAELAGMLAGAGVRDIVADLDYAMCRRFGIRGSPTAVRLDADGRLAGQPEHGIASIMELFVAGTGPASRPVPGTMIAGMPKEEGAIGSHDHTR